MNYIYIAAVIVLILFLMAEYNRLIAKKNQNDNAFSAIDVFLKKRHDLIPNIVESVRAYMKHEQETLIKVAELRSQAVSGTLSADQRMHVENQISRGLGTIMVAAENYPELKASQQFLNLEAALNEAEEQISAARRAFNAAVTEYNDAIQMFPTKLMASAMGLTPRAVFAASAEDRENPDVARLLKS